MVIEMEKQKQHYLYVLVPETGKDFKIGISCGPMARFKGLSVKPDLRLSRIFTGNRLTIINLEKALHSTFFPWNAPWENKSTAGRTEWFTKDCLEGVFKHIDLLNDLWGGVITPVTNDELLKRPVERRERSCDERLDITSYISFVDENDDLPFSRIYMTSLEPGGTKVLCNALHALYKLRDKYPWDTDVVRIPAEEFEKVIGSDDFEADPTDYLSSVVRASAEYYGGLGNSCWMCSAWFMPIKYNPHGYLEAVPSKFTRKVKDMDFDGILKLQPS